MPITVTITPGDPIAAKLLELVGASEIKLELTPTPVAIHHVHENIQSLIEAAPQEQPEARAIEELSADPRTRDVATYLLKPLVDKKLTINGNVRDVLLRTALEFADVPSHKLKFAARRLVNGKHEVFPVPDEIYAAIGRYRATAQSTEVVEELNGQQAA